MDPTRAVCPMTSLDPVVFRELPVIQKIIADEMWLEGERRGGPVSADDPGVQEQVCAVIMRIGAELRTALTSQVEAEVGQPGGADFRGARVA